MQISNTDSKELQELFEQTFWFTYRKNFPVLLDSQDYKNKQAFTTDQGWGCMLRVGQNLFAEVLKRHFFEHQIDKNNDDILKEFMDDKHIRYSIHEIAEISYKLYDMLPGVWYQPNKIMGCLQNIQENNPMPGSENLQILSLNSDVPIVYEQILEKMIKKNGNLPEQNQQEFKQEQEQEEEKEKEENKENNQKEQQQQKEDKQYNSILLVINSRIGLENTPPHYLEIIKHMLQFELCMGIIGGNLGSAHYFIGTKSNQLIYLDPHTTQEASNSKNFESSENQKSYFCKNIKYLPLKCMSQTLGISFYLKNEEDLQIFRDFIQKLQKKYEDFFWYFMEKTPDYMKEGYKSPEYEEEETDDGFIIMH